MKEKAVGYHASAKISNANAVMKGRRMKITIKYEYDIMLPECARYVAKAYNGSVLLGLNCRESFEEARVAVIQYVKEIKTVDVPPAEEVEVELC